MENTFGTGISSCSSITALTTALARAQQRWRSDEPARRRTENRCASPSLRGVKDSGRRDRPARPGRTGQSGSGLTASVVSECACLEAAK